MSNKDEIIDLLEFTAGTVEISSDSHLKHSVIKKHYLREIVDKGFGIDKVYFSGDFPSIYFKRVQSFSDDTLKEIAVMQKKIWNQGKVPMLYVDSPTEIRIYNCYETPLNPERELNKISTQLEMAAFNKGVVSELEKLKTVFGKVSVDSGKFWSEKEFSRNLDNQKRVNKALIQNLKRTRNHLISNNVEVPVIHDLMLRSLFLLYLEDRKATNTEFYSKFKVGANSYFDLLYDIDSTYSLFSKLEEHFNGSISPVTNAERQSVNKDVLEHIRQCFWSENDSPHQQKLFDWRIFDFSIIPIELISELYEEFLAEEEGENQKSKDGAYYTPHALVEFVLNKELPYPGSSKDSQNYNVKVLDPTCGSGIFLVESLNRLLDRWKFQNPNKSFEFDTIKEITENNIFGIEKNPEAIKVAAFSIYLAMLDRLEPKTLWETKSFPHLIYNPTSKSNRGNNLFCMSSLSNGPFENIDFDLIVGNPPFKRGDINEEGKSYLQKHNFAQEYVLAFLHRATTLAPSSKIALVCASKILFNKTGGYVSFREFLFQKNYVDSIYNFSILRKAHKSDGGSLFASAIGPACVIFYKAGEVTNKSPKLLYCAPKTSLKNNIIDGIAIDATDIRYLPRTECEDSTSIIWKVGMWGTMADYSFIKRLSEMPNLYDAIESQNWSTGVGLQTSNPQTKENFEISKMPIIDAKFIQRYHTPQASTRRIQTTLFRRLGAVEAYKAPHVLIKEGQSEKRFCASFLDYDCTFTSTVFGIHSDDALSLKVLTAYLNSSFASYYLFLTASTWGIERERVKPNELLMLPDFCTNISKSARLEIASEVDRIIELKKSNKLIEKEPIREAEKRIDMLFENEFSFSKKEASHVQDVLDYSLDLFQEGDKSMAYKPCSLDTLKGYASAISNELNLYLQKGSDLRVWSTVFDSFNNSPLTFVRINLNSIEKANHVGVIAPPEGGKILREIEKYCYERYSESIYYRKSLIWFNDDSIIIIKPNEVRFWSSTMANSDFRDLVSQVLST